MVLLIDTTNEELLDDLVDEFVELRKQNSGFPGIQFSYLDCHDSDD